MGTDDDHNGVLANFSMVEKGIYRSGIPQPENFSFLKTLNLCSIIYLCPETYPEDNLKFLQANNIKLFQFPIDGKTDPRASMPKDIVLDALKVLADVRNHPILIHCKRGKHRTGCFVGCFRKVQNWCLSSVFDDYQKNAGLGWRQRDLEFIEAFDVINLRHCFLSIMYQYHGYGFERRRLLYEEINV